MCGCKLGLSLHLPQHEFPCAAGTLSTERWPWGEWLWRAQRGVLLCPHGTCLSHPSWPHLPVHGLPRGRTPQLPALHRQRAGEPARGRGVAAPGDPALMDLEFPRSGSHREQEKHSQGRAMGKGPPRGAPSPSSCLTAQPGIPCRSREEAAASPRGEVLGKVPPASISGQGDVGGVGAWLCGEGMGGILGCWG
ncbi:hypothetical protein LUU34_00115700 [Aix galericulata]|nr:hypothetical protein LUU34_00115700 [Aix galericulata]